MMKIRNATIKDSNQIRKVYHSAFPKEENTVVAALAANLLKDETTPPTISLIAEVDPLIVGHIAFNPLRSDNLQWQGYILAPLAVLPGYQNRSIGSKLIDHGMQQLRKLHVNRLFVYGDPNYYGRFGFTAQAASNYTPPYTLQYPHGWLAIPLENGDAIASPVNIRCVQSLSHPELW